MRTLSYKQSILLLRVCITVFILLLVSLALFAGGGKKKTCRLSRADASIVCDLPGRAFDFNP
jgi:hypothetical protein